MIRTNNILIVKAQTNYTKIQIHSELCSSIYYTNNLNFQGLFLEAIIQS